MAQDAGRDAKSGAAIGPPHARVAPGTKLADWRAVFWYAAYAHLHLGAVTLAAFSVVAAYVWPRFARLGFAALFASMSTFHWALALLRPEMYLGSAGFAVFDVYRETIERMSPSDVMAVVGGLSTVLALTTLGIAVGDGAARTAFVVATVLLVALAPLGLAAAFPATLLLAAGTSLLACTPHALAGSFLDAVGLGLAERRLRTPPKTVPRSPRNSPRNLGIAAHHPSGARRGSSTRFASTHSEKMLRGVAEFETRTKRREPTMKP